ncbi:MAG: single-stranded DNA-binding protein [Gammaproteobacteria bacterium]
MTTIQLYGRLGRDPEERTTAGGKSMVTASMVVNLGRDEELSEWFSLVAFHKVGERLALHVKGDMVAVNGKLSKNTWNGKDGEKRSGFSVLVDCLASAKAAAPVDNKGSPKEGAGKGARDEPFYDDPLPF